MKIVTIYTDGKAGRFEKCPHSLAAGAATARG